MSLFWVMIILIVSGLALARLNWPFLFLILRSCNHPPVANLRDDPEGGLNFAAAPKSTLIIGVPGSGKTIYAVQQVARYALEHPECAIVSLEISGAFKREMLKYALSVPKGEQLIGKFKVDELCRRDAVKPMPEFSKAYGLPLEDQIQRVSTTLKQLHQKTVELNPTLAEAFDGPARELFRLLVACRGPLGDCFQITEGNELLTNQAKCLLALHYFGAYAPSAQQFFEDQYWHRDVSSHDRHMLTTALKSALSDLETREARATLGCPDPAYTFGQAIDRRQMVMISGEHLLNQRVVMGYLLVQRFSLLMQEINKRKANGDYAPVIIIVDELPWLLKSTGLSEEIGDLYSYYRNRNVGVMVIIQNLSQLSEVLLEKVWNFGNIVTFADENFEEAQTLGKNLFTYNALFPKYAVPVPGKEDTYQGQVATVANFIMNLRARECLVKRYVDQQTKDPYVRHVRRTKDLPRPPDEPTLEALNERLALEDTVPVAQALNILGQRKLQTPQPGESQRRGA